MRYETFCIEGAATPFYGVLPDGELMSEQITSMYRVAARQGGRIIAAHNLLCNLEHPFEAKTPTKVHCLFLVAEYPHQPIDDYEDPDEEPAE